MVGVDVVGGSRRRRLDERDFPPIAECDDVTPLDSGCTVADAKMVLKSRVSSSSLLFSPASSPLLSSSKGFPGLHSKLKSVNKLLNPKHML